MHKTMIIICERKVKYQADILEKNSFFEYRIICKNVIMNGKTERYSL